MIKKWHHLISGFTQDIDQPTGIEKLWMEMRQFSDPETCIQMHTWDTNWQHVAAQNHRCADQPAQVFIYAYSWGAGWGFVKLAEELGKLGRLIDGAVLCDPVYREGWAPTWFNLLPMSLTDIPQIHVPPNVEDVWWCFQRNSVPSGHTPVPAPGTQTWVREGVQLKDATHLTADESDWFHQTALQVARDMTWK